MNPDELFDCSNLIKSLNSDLKNRSSNSERVVLWTDHPIPLNQSQSTENLRYFDVAHEETSILLDPTKVPGCEHQIATLKENGFLESSSDDRVMVITVKLRNEIGALAKDLSINSEVIQSVEDFKTIRLLWERFNVDPMNSFSWNLSWWKSFQRHGRLHLLRFERAGRTVGFAPFYVDRWFGLKRLRFLATGDACTDYTDLICEQEHYELCAWSFAEYIREQEFQVVELECTKNDRLSVSIKKNLEKKYRFDHRIVEPTWRLDLTNTWEEFVRQTKGSLRRKINKATKRLSVGSFHVKSLADGLDIEYAFGLLKELHTRRWKSLGKPGVFADSQFEEFLEMAVVEFHQERKCEIVIVYENETPIGAQLYFVSSEGYQLYQSGYEPKAMKLEPGHMLFASMVQRAIKRKDSCFDFLRGNEPYKEFWGAKPHIQTKLRLVLRKPIPNIIAKVIGSTRRICRGG